MSEGQLDEIAYRETLPSAPGQIRAATVSERLALQQAQLEAQLKLVREAREALEKNADIAAAFDKVSKALHIF